jgi:L-amino acid N-acyltransferase YncA
MTTQQISRIRRLEPRDLDHAATLCNTVIARGESTYGPGPLTAEELRGELFGIPAEFESWAYEEDDGVVVGWAALTRHTHRDIYDTVAEVVVFVSAGHRRRGIGRALAKHALARASALGFRVLLVMLQPEPSYAVAWAVRLGFRNVGFLSAVLPVGGEWRDILVFQRFLKSPGSDDR